MSLLSDLAQKVAMLWDGRHPCMRLSIGNVPDPRYPKRLCFGGRNQTCLQVDHDSDDGRMAYLQYSQTGADGDLSDVMTAGRNHEITGAWMGPGLWEQATVSGTINSINDTFTIPLAADAVMLFRSGVLLDPASARYSLAAGTTSTTITIATPAEDARAAEGSRPADTFFCLAHRSTFG